MTHYRLRVQSPLVKESPLWMPLRVRSKYILNEGQFLKLLDQALGLRTGLFDSPQKQSVIERIGQLRFPLLPQTLSIDAMEKVRGRQ